MPCIIIVRMHSALWAVACARPVVLPALPGCCVHQHRVAQMPPIDIPQRLHTLTPVATSRPPLLASTTRLGARVGGGDVLLLSLAGRLCTTRVHLLARRGRRTVAAHEQLDDACHRPRSVQIAEIACPALRLANGHGCSLEGAFTSAGEMSMHAAEWVGRAAEAAAHRPLCHPRSQCSRHGCCRWGCANSRRRPSGADKPRAA